MNFFTRVSARNAEMEAALADWLRQQGSGLAWPKADRVAFLLVLLVLLAMLTAYGVPDTEATIWLRTQIAFWMNAALFTSMGATALALIVWNGGKGLTIRLEEAPAQPIEAGEAHAAIEEGGWTYPNGMSPYLSSVDKLRISQSVNPKLNEETASKIKAGIAAGMTTAEIAQQTGYSLDTVKKYAALIRKGFEATESAPLSFDL